jgi:hypothetical protein
LVIEVCEVELVLAPKEFDEYQVILIQEIIEDIAVKLKEAGLSGETLENTTAHIAFSVASAIDDTAGIERDGVAVKPYLTFRTKDDEIIHCGENAFTYEYVPRLLDKLFGA